jgi:hypothetical protein
MRASHVEPDDVGDWYADLEPVGGPKLGPFKTRRMALAAEIDWLDAQLRDAVIMLERGDAIRRKVALDHEMGHPITEEELMQGYNPKEDHA